MGRGVSHCASCDGPLYNGQVVGVVGGGDSALQEALTLANYAEQVLLFITAKNFPRQQLLSTKSVEQLKDHRRAIKLLIEEILGDDVVSGVRVRDLATERSIASRSGRSFRLRRLAAEHGVFEKPREAQRHRACADGCLDENRRVTVSMPSAIFARIPRRQAITSAGDGATAAIAAYRYIKETFR